MSGKSPSEMPSSAFHVSLAGGQEESMSAALDEAMTRLAAVTGRPVSPTEDHERPKEHHELPEEQPRTELTNPTQAASLALPMLEAMCIASSRREAAKVLVTMVSTVCPEASVRCGIGQAKIKYFLDSRLGWLGSESVLYQEAEENWHSYSRRSDDETINTPCVGRRGETIEFHLPRVDGTGRCVLWIKGPSESVIWMPEYIRTFASVLWSRPPRSLPSLAIKMAKRTTVFVTALGILMTVMAIWPVQYRVSCRARVETTGQRFISSPFEATLLETKARPGDAVSAGDILLVLDGRPLRLEREAVEAEIGQISKEHDVALATRKIAEAQQANLRRKQLTRQLELITDRLARLEVTSPIDGVVVSGDLRHHIGSPLELGQTLIEIAPMEKMSVELEVPAHEISYVNVGSDARIKIDAVDGPSIRLPLGEIYPAAEIRDDNNVFVSRIELDNTQQKLRPGMEGEATIYGPLRPWIWSWVRGSVEKVMWWIGY